MKSTDKLEEIGSSLDLTKPDVNEILSQKSKFQISLANKIRGIIIFLILVLFPVYHILLESYQESHYPYSIFLGQTIKQRGKKKENCGLNPLTALILVLLLTCIASSVTYCTMYGVYSREAKRTRL